MENYQKRCRRPLFLDDAASPESCPNPLIVGRSSTAVHGQRVPGAIKLKVPRATMVPHINVAKDRCNALNSAGKFNNTVAAPSPTCTANKMAAITHSHHIRNSVDRCWYAEYKVNMRMRPMMTVTSR
jgi:hypothetical protein